MKNTDLIEFQFRQEEELKRRRRIKNQFEYDRLTKQTRTRTESSTIPDMRDAYRQVRKSNASIPRSVVNATTGKPYK